MVDVGKSTADGLGISLCLVDMLPTIPLQLAFNTARVGLPGCTPKVYAAWPKTRTDGLDFSHAPPLGSECDAMTVLHKEILKSTHGTEDKAIQPTWLLTVASIGSVGVKAVESKGGDDPDNLRASLSPAGCVSRSPALHASRSPTLCASISTHLCAGGFLVPHSSSHSPPISYIGTIILQV